jgi:hypothetical protein
MIGYVPVEREAALFHDNATTIRYPHSSLLGKVDVVYGGVREI